MKKYAEQIINFIQIKENYFTYCIYREDSLLFNDEFKDINKLGRDIKKIIIIDDRPDNIQFQSQNGIIIKPYIIDRNNPKDNDYILYDLQRILLRIAKENPDDIRESLRKYKNEIINKISL
jgi:TFIIF-interacting CTD phosphatase-like protein